MSCAIYTHTPARKSSTNFQLYCFVIQICSTNWLGHGHGYKWHSSLSPLIALALSLSLVVVLSLWLGLLTVLLVLRPPVRGSCAKEAAKALKLGWKHVYVHTHYIHI